MTGTQIGNNPLLAAYGAVLVAIITAFAIYDLYKRRVPNKALAFSAPVFLAAPILAAWDGGSWSMAVAAGQIIWSLLGGAGGLRHPSVRGDAHQRRLWCWRRRHQVGRPDWLCSRSLWDDGYVADRLHFVYSGGIVLQDAKENGGVVFAFCTIPRCWLLPGLSILNHQLKESINMKLNNRFLFGILSILLAAIIAFVALPTISRQTNGKTEIVRVTPAGAERRCHHRQGCGDP